jgi:hypothetical protein
VKSAVVVSRNLPKPNSMWLRLYLRIG